MSSTILQQTHADTSDEAARTTLRGRIMPFRRRTNPWPDPERSIGEFISTISGNYVCWDLLPSGPACTLWNVMQRDIRNVLSGADALPAGVLWPCYMMGKSQDKARPTVVFCNPRKNTRRSVRKVVLDSGILDDYVGFATADFPHDPGSANLVPLGSSHEISLHEAKLSIWQHTKSGRCVVRSSAEGLPQRIASIGGLLRLGACDYAMTAAHVVRSESSLFPGWSKHEESDTDSLSIDGDDDNDAQPTSHNEATRNPRLSFTSFETKLSDDDLEAAAPKSELVDDVKTIHRYVPKLERSSLWHDREDSWNEYNLVKWPHDWYSHDGPQVLILPGTSDCVLIRLSPSMVERLGRPVSFGSLIPKNIQPEGAISIKSMNVQLYSGYLLFRKIYITTQARRKTQELWLLRCEDDVKPVVGECGSWIIHNDTNEVCGQLVAGDPVTGIYYLVPTYSIVRGIENLADQGVLNITSSVQHGSTISDHTYDDLQITLPQIHRSSPFETMDVAITQGSYNSFAPMMSLDHPPPNAHYSLDRSREIAQRYSEILSIYQPGTSDYNKVHKAYLEWFNSVSGNLVEVTAKEELSAANHNDNEDNDDISDQYIFETAQGTVTVNCRTAVDVNGKL